MRNISLVVLSASCMFFAVNASDLALAKGNLLNVSLLGKHGIHLGVGLHTKHGVRLGVHTSVGGKKGTHVSAHVGGKTHKR